MIQPKCDRCGHELLVPAGLVFSPPESGNTVRKFHLCVGCYEAFRSWIQDTNLLYELHKFGSELRRS